MQILRDARKREKQILILLSIIIIVIYLFPFYICVVNAFKTPLETAESAVALPGHLILDNFREAAKKISFGTAIKDCDDRGGCSNCAMRVHERLCHCPLCKSQPLFSLPGQSVYELANASLPGGHDSSV